MARCDPWGEWYLDADRRELCGTFMDVWGPYIWVALALVALIVVALAIRGRRTAEAPSAAPQQTAAAHATTELPDTQWPVAEAGSTAVDGERWPIRELLLSFLVIGFLLFLAALWASTW